MKKVLLFVSCFALLLIVSNVSVAQDEAVAACPVCQAGTQGLVLPVNHPGLGVDNREIRRLTTAQGRIATRQMRLEARYAVPQLQYLPAVGGMGEFAPGETYALPGGPVVQTGRRNSNVQRVTANNAPVINFMSLVRGSQPPYPPYYAPVQ